MNKFIHKIVCLLYPNRCVFCDKVIEENISVCESCIKGIKEHENHHSFRTMFGKIRCVSPFIYDGLPKKAISWFKYHNAKNNAAALARYMIFQIRRYYKGVKFDYAVYIPTTAKRKRERGYNQSELLYKEIAPRIGVGDNDEILIKTSETKEQKWLNYAERIGNLANAFSVSDKYNLNGKTILIIDDVHTTGATIDAAAKALYNSGAKEVMAVTFARVQK